MVIWVNASDHFSYHLNQSVLEMMITVDTKAITNDIVRCTALHVL